VIHAGSQGQQRETAPILATAFCDGHAKALNDLLKNTSSIEATDARGSRGHRAFVDFTLFNDDRPNPADFIAMVIINTKVSPIPTSN
jgi:hypothetical protein